MTGIRVLVSSIAAVAMAMVGIAATSPGQAVDPPPYTKATPASHDFGIQKVGVASTSFTFLIGNDYGFPIDFTTNSFTGPDAADFKITANSCTSNNFGEFSYCNISVQFTPSSPGPKTATLEVKSQNAPPSPVYYERTMPIPLSGTGALPQLSATPSPLDFGGQPVGTDSVEQILTVANTGDVPLKITSSDVTGPDAGQFQVIYDACGGATLAPADTCEVWYAFSPTSAGTKSAQVDVVSDAEGSPHIVPINATGAVPLVAADPAVDLGDQLVGSTSSPISVTVSNTGGAALEVFETSLAGGDSASFAIASETCTAAKVPAGGTCEVNLTFSPATTGTKSADLTIVSDAANSPTLIIPVQGSGITAPAPVVPGPGPTSGSENDPATNALREQSAQTAALPSRIKRKGRTVILPANATTNAGQAITAKVKATPKRSPKGTKTYKVIRAKNGKVVIRTFGYKKLRVKVTVSAPSTTGFAPYAVQATYYKGKRR